MKKYNLSNIMKKAWTTYKKFKNMVSPLSFSECLKRAWEEAKKATEKVNEITLETVKAATNKLVISGEYENVSFREWNGYGKSRIYIKAFRHTLAGNLRIAECGYWDCQLNKYIPQAINLLS